MRFLWVSGLLLLSLASVPFAVAQDQPAEPDVAVSADPTAPSPKIEATLSEIRELEQLREENRRLLARLEELEARSDQLADMVLRGVAIGADGSSAALLEINGVSQLVREGSELSPPRSRDQAGPGKMRLLVKQILDDGVHLEMGDSGETFVVR